MRLLTGKGRHSTVGEADSAYCARPDCPSSETAEYFIDRIIGRRPSLTQPGSNGVPKFLFLVRWQGCVPFPRISCIAPSAECSAWSVLRGGRWGVQDATWEFPENLGDYSPHISEFEVAAELEGKDLSDPNATTLLNEASSGGW